MSLIILLTWLPEEFMLFTLAPKQSVVFWQSYFKGHKSCLNMPELTINISSVPQELVTWGGEGPKSPCSHLVQMH